MTGGIILAADYSICCGRFSPFSYTGGKSRIKWIIERLRNDDIGYIVVITGFRHADIEKHLHDEGVNCVFDPEYFADSTVEKIRLGIGSLLSTLSDAVIINITGSEYNDPIMIKKEYFEDMIFDDEQTAAKILAGNSEVRALSKPDCSGGDASATIRINNKVINNELICLLELISDCGNITQAAKAMNMSYSKAWQLLKEYPDLIIKIPGGKTGGSTSVTEEGMRLVHNYKSLQKELDNRLDQSFEKHFLI